MFRYLANVKGAVEVNGTLFPNIQEATKAFEGFEGDVVIKFNKESGCKKQPAAREEETDDTIYRIKVRQYMTKPSSPDFDFMAKFNNNVPMPMRIMVGKKLQETKGMVKMELWCDITQPITTHCMKCGKPLTNSVSKYFGVGPECGGHNYVNPFNSDEELKEAVAEVRTKLQKIRWTGWIIKAAIEEEVRLDEDVIVGC